MSAHTAIQFDVNHNNAEYAHTHTHTHSGVPTQVKRGHGRARMETVKMSQTIFGLLFYNGK